MAAAYQHETSRAGDPHLHTHVLVPNRQARADGRLVSIDGTSLFHEARAAGIIYQATLRHELHRLIGVEWGAGGRLHRDGRDRRHRPENHHRLVDAQHRVEEAASNLTVVEGGKNLSQAQLAAAQKATRPRKPESLSWAELREQWRAERRGVSGSSATVNSRRVPPVNAVQRPPRVTRSGIVDRRAVAAMASRADKAALTRADLVEIIGAQLPLIVDSGAGEDGRHRCPVRSSKCAWTPSGCG